MHAKVGRQEKRWCSGKLQQSTQGQNKHCAKRKMRRGGRAQNPESSMSAGGNESMHSGSMHGQVCSQVKGRTARERLGLGNLKARAAKTEGGGQSESSLCVVSVGLGEQLDA